MEVAAAAVAGAPAAGSPQLDVELSFAWGSPLTQPPPGAVVGAVLLGGAATVSVTMADTAGGANGSAALGGSNGSAAVLQVSTASGVTSMTFSTGDGSAAAMVLRIVVDGGVVEAFAMHGRAQAVAVVPLHVSLKNTTVALVAETLSMGAHNAWVVGASLWRLAY
jgi:hypothetical protein